MCRRVVFFIFFSVFSLCQTGDIFAQQRWFEATAGVALSMPDAKGSPLMYKPRILPHGGISCYFSFNETFALKTGAFYQMKGLHTDAYYVPDSLYEFERFTSKNDYHFISIPLQMAVNFGKSRQRLYRVAVGMSYGFLLAAQSEITIDSYFDEMNKVRTTAQFSQLVTAQPKNDIDGMPLHEGTPVHFFVPALRFDFVYQWQERFIIGAFYEYNLQDIRWRTVNSSKMNLHSAGLSVGVKFW